MTPDDLTNRVRAHYLEQFREFAREQRSRCERGATEVKIQMNGEGGVHRNLYCVDFISNDGGAPQIHELQPDRFLKFEPLSGQIGDTRLSIDALRWDDVIVEHDASISASQIDAWFERWFDPEEKRLDFEAELSDAIHSLLLSDGCVSVDLGTAPSAAFWELLELVAMLGASSIRVSSSRAEAEA